MQSKEIERNKMCQSAEFITEYLGYTKEKQRSETL
nr:MAG TPA: hypothetical protein [Caudoviricetes sp.]